MQVDSPGQVNADNDWSEHDTSRKASLGASLHNNTVTKHLNLLDGLGTTEETSATGSNKTRLLTSRRIAGDGRGLTNVLVVTTTAVVCQ
jgi:hypothetical protein